MISDWAARCALRRFVGLSARRGLCHVRQTMIVRTGQRLLAYRRVVCRRCHRAHRGGGRRIASCRPLSLLILATVGCGDTVDPSIASDPQIVVRASPDTITALGNRAVLQALQITNVGDTTGVRATWESSDTTVVSIWSGNVAVAHREGSVLITARTPDSLSGNATLVVRQRPHEVRIFADSFRLREAESLALAAAAVDANGNALTYRPVTWSVDPPTLARFDSAAQRLVALRKGAVDVRATVDGVSGQRRFVITDGFVVQSIFNSTFQGRICAVDLDSLAACWPHGDSVATNLSDTLRFRSFTSGDDHDCGTTIDDRALCIGRDGHGELGLGFITGRHDTLVAAWPDLTFRFVMAADHDFTCGITLVGEPLCWGHNDLGQLGRNRKRGDGPDVAPVVGVTTLDTVDVEGLHTCGLAPGGIPYCWGAWKYGGADSVAVPVPGGHVFTQVSTGWGHTCGLTPAGEAYCWGFYNAGAFGNGDSLRSETPVRVRYGGVLRQISAGELHTCGVTAGDAVVCWGDNSRMQLGVPGPTALTPQLVPGLPPVTRVAAGNVDTCVITELRSVLCWGNGSADPWRVLRGDSTMTAFVTRTGRDVPPPGH